MSMITMCLKREDEEAIDDARWLELGGADHINECDEDQFSDLPPIRRLSLYQSIHLVFYRIIINENIIQLPLVVVLIKHTSANILPHLYNSQKREDVLIIASMAMTSGA